jgi:hypothetical protein
MKTTLHERVAQNPTEARAERLAADLVTFGALLTTVEDGVEDYLDALECWRGAHDVRHERAYARERLASSDLAADLCALGRFLDGLPPEVPA